MKGEKRQREFGSLFRLLWSDSRSEIYRLYTAKVTVHEK